MARSAKRNRPRNNHTGAPARRPRKETPLEILYILNTLVLGFFLWDIHKGTREITQIAKDIAVMTKEVSDKTDAILGRLR